MCLGIVWGLFGGWNERTSEQRTNNPHTRARGGRAGGMCGGCSFVVRSFVRSSPKTTPKQSQNTPKTLHKKSPHDPDKCVFTCDNVSINRMTESRIFHCNPFIETPEATSQARSQSRLKHSTYTWPPSKADHVSTHHVSTIWFARKSTPSERK